MIEKRSPLNVGLTDLEKSLLLHGLKLLRAKNIFPDLDPGGQNRLCKIFGLIEESLSTELELPWRGIDHE